MIGWGQVMAAQEYRGDLLRQAEEWRLAHPGYDARSNAIYRRALAWLGYRLSDWGEQLQERYDDACAARLEMTLDGAES